jgi:hypothetical protein
VATPYGQFLRWVWIPSHAVTTAPFVTVDEPGFLAAETTAGYYYPERWAVVRAPTGEYVWEFVPGAFQPR